MLATLHSMRRKNPPKSHTYMILGLLVVILGVAAFAAHDYTNNDGASLADESATIERPQGTSLSVEEGNGLHQGAQNIDGSVLQSSTTNIQSAGGVEVYENFDTQSANQGAVQPQ